MTTITISLNDKKEADLIIEIAKRMGSVKYLKSGKRNFAVPGEPMDLKEFKSMISKSEKSGFISVEQLELNVKKW